MINYELHRWSSLSRQMRKEVIDRQHKKIKRCLNYSAMGILLRHHYLLDLRLSFNYEKHTACIQGTVLVHGNSTE